MAGVYLSLGSNLGDRMENLRRALGELEREGVRIRRFSTVYETQPLEQREQPWFLNLVVEGETELGPLELLEKAKQIERRLGRVWRGPKGPREIDIDILLYGELVMVEPHLQIPHPRMAARRFVLEPLAELAPQLRHPVLGLTVGELLTRTLDQQVRPLKERMIKESG